MWAALLVFLGTTLELPLQNEVSKFWLVASLEFHSGSHDSSLVNIQIPAVLMRHACWWQFHF